MSRPQAGRPDALLELNPVRAFVAAARTSEFSEDDLHLVVPAGRPIELGVRVRQALRAGGHPLATVLPTRERQKATAWPGRSGLSSTPPRPAFVQRPITRSCA